jgi:hypothetical protein
LNLQVGGGVEKFMLTPPLAVPLIYSRERIITTAPKNRLVYERVHRTAALKKEALGE